MEYAFTTSTTLSFPDALARTKEVLAKAGFGILTEIDVQATMQEKLGASYRPYVILGACNPPLAHAAIQAQHDIGLFLPCNVIVYETEDGVRVAAIRPEAAMSMIENDALKKVAREAQEKLETAIAQL